ncbi:MAG: response regulator [Lachnospiraceae bacterium]|nr:response regulator [Lachnospiraceae bacterium]
MLYYKAQIYGIFVIAVLFFMCWFGIKEKSRENIIFNIILLAAFINLTFDIASNYTVNHLETVHPMINRMVHICFFHTMATLFVLVYKYLVALVEKELGTTLKGRILTWVPYIVVFILELFLPVYYMETVQGNYSYGPGPNMLYVCVITYMILTIVLIIRQRKNISLKNKVAVILAFVSVTGTSMFQLFVPIALTSSLGVILFCLCMYMTVANPDAVLVGLLKEETARADAANRAKSDFLARMSHEIRTPINAILGMNEMVLRESTETSIKKYAHDIKSSARALLSIINEILDSSKIESGKMEIISAEYEISSLLNDLYNMINVKAKDKELVLNFQIDPGIPTEYCGDDIRIRQVLMNLLTNAVKYTNEGTITMTVTGRMEGENAILSYSVKDTGIGIKEEDIDKLFASFERIEESRNRHIEGTGLGMNIAMQLLALMDSELKVKSEYGKGSEFYFDIVQKVTNAEPLGDFQKRIILVSEESEYSTSYIAPEAKVLVVDDNEMNRKVFKNLLKHTLINVYEAGGGEECIAMVEQQEFDIVFLDFMMPIMDGVETLHTIKERNLCNETPIIMLTANAVVGVREQCLREGFHDYLTKPIMPEKLDKMILQYLPVELVKEGDYSKEKTTQEYSQLPQLDEFDFDYAMNLLKSEEILLNTLEDFHDLLKRLPRMLSELEDSILQEESRTRYRIEVHALKSSAATVGALLLSKVARLLELAAANHDVERIYVLHPILLEEIEKHKERIASILPQEEKKVMLDNIDEVLPYFDMLKSNLENDDYNNADFISSEIQKYAYSEEIQPLVEQLASQVMNLEAEEAIITIEKIKGETES